MNFDRYIPPAAQKAILGAISVGLGSLAVSGVLGPIVSDVLKIAAGVFAGWAGIRQPGTTPTDPPPPPDSPP
jgi:hypothetical protein